MINMVIKHKAKALTKTLARKYIINNKIHQR